MRLSMSAFVLLSAAVPSFVFAAPKKDDKSIPGSAVFQISDSQGAVYSCARSGKKIVYVIREKKKFFPGSVAVEHMQDKVDGAKSKAKKKKLAKQLKDLKKEVKARGNECKNYTPGSTNLTPIGRPLTRADVQYLLDKAGLGLSSREEYLVDIGVNQGVDALVTEFMRQKAEPAGLLDRLADRQDNQLGSNHTPSPAGQRAALLDLWINTNNPYSEKFALFLLSVWTVSGDVIEDETFRASFWDYYTRLRETAAGQSNMPDLGVAVTRDPLMLIYLNNELNVKSAPNENFARELMELFTLGPTDIEGNPNYTETKPDGSGDIAVAARMLTGWKVKKDYTINKLVTQYDGTRHANGPHKMFAGTDYAFSGDTDEDLVRGIFAHHPGAKNYYAKEILKRYLTPNPSPELIKAFGAVIAANNYNLRPAMKSLFESEAFYSDSYKDTVPVDSMEFAAKAARLLGMFNAVEPSEGQRQLEQMGMQFNFAPSVFWYNPDTWVSSSVLLEKANYVAQILGDSSAQHGADPDWTPALALPSGAASTTQVIQHVAAKLGIAPLSSVESSQLEGYMKKVRQYNDSYLDYTYNNLDPEKQKLKGMGVYYLLFLNKKFQLN